MRRGDKKSNAISICPCIQTLVICLETTKLSWEPIPTIPDLMPQPIQVKYNFNLTRQMTDVT